MDNLREGTLAPLRFIPFRRSDVIKMCLAGNRLDAAGTECFKRAQKQIESVYSGEFHTIRQQLKDAYGPLDPDADTRLIAGVGEGSLPVALAATIETVLERGNYERVSEQALQSAFAAASMFHIKLHVDLDAFDEVLLFTRGANLREERVKTWFGLGKKTIRFTNYDRVVLFLRFNDHSSSEETTSGRRPGSTMLKLFQNVPDADLEMLFPNTRVGMRLRDKLLIGVPALISGGIVFTTKLGATLVLMGSLLGFWLGAHSEPVTLDRGGLLVLLAGFGAVGGYIWKQYSSFRNRKMRFSQALTENLYFKLLDNNSGVLLRIVDDAEESECKESLLAYYFLLAMDTPCSADAVDTEIESWFAQRWQCHLDFEIDDAMDKLQDLGLAQCENGLWHALQLTEENETQ